MVAIARRRRRIDTSGAHWPGFVDAMATLLLVIIFLLTVFVIAQFLLAREISGRDTVLNELRSQLAELTDLLALERASTRSLEASLAGLTDDIASAEAERTRLAGLVAELEGENAAVEQQVVILRDQLEEARSGRQEALAEFERQQRTIIDLRSEAGRRQARIAELERDLAAAERAREDAVLAASAQEAVIVDLRSEAEKNEAALAALAREAEAVRQARDRAQTIVDSQRIMVVDLRRQAAETDEQLTEAESSLQNAREARERLAAALEERSEAEAAARDEAEESARRLVVLSDELQRAESERDSALAAARAAQDELVVLQDRHEQEIATLRGNLAATTAELEATEDAEAEAERQRQIVIDLRKEKSEQESRIASLSGSLTTAEQARDSALREVEFLNIQLAALRRQISALQVALDASEERDVEQEAQIADLGRRLNVALAQKVKELSRYRSEFFGKLRQILSDRDDIRVVGDRFVFQSEVLFPSGSATINPAGRSELDKLAEALIALEEEIPPELNWVLRVDGHTDRRPITFSFRSNWELSAARAISVVQYLVDKGVSPRRLVAAGFGEFQPLDSSGTEEAFSRNRRIELKLTER